MIGCTENSPGESRGVERSRRDTEFSGRGVNWEYLYDYRVFNKPTTPRTSFIRNALNLVHLLLPFAAAEEPESRTTAC
jgi:hypothetical protein